MASIVFTRFKQDLAQGEFDLDVSGDDIRVSLHMTNTDCDTLRDTALNSSFNANNGDEFDGSGYSAGGAALTSEAVNEDTGNDRAEFDAADLTFSALSAGTRAIQGALVYKFTTNWNSSQPICWVDFPSTVTANGGDIVISWNAEGILQFGTIGAVTGN